MLKAKPKLERILFCHGPVRKGDGSVVVHMYTSVHGVLCGLLAGKKISYLIDIGWKIRGAEEVGDHVNTVSRDNNVGVIVCASCEKYARAIAEEQLQSKKGYEVSSD